MRLPPPNSLVRSIRGRLLLVVAALLLPAALLTAWLIRQDYVSQRKATERHLRESARALSLLVDASLREREALLQGLASSWQLQVGDYAAFRALAQAAMQGREGWVVLTDPENRQRVNTSQPVEAVLPTIASNPEQARVHDEGRTYFSNFGVGTASRRQMVSVSMAIDRSEGRHILALALPPEALSRTLLDNRIGQDWLVSLVDRTGTIAARSRNPERYLGTQAGQAMRDHISRSPEGVAETISLDGVHSLTAFSRSALTGWTVILAAPQATVFGPARRVLAVALAVAILSALGASFTAAWAGRAIVDAIGTLVTETQALGRGELLAPRRTGINEIDFVSRALADTSRELAERQAALERARDAAVAASRAKDEILAALSHELRTPLNPVLLLASDAAHDPAYPAAARDAFATIAKNAMLEARLIDDLLDLTRITRGKMSLEKRPVDLHAVLRDALATVQGELTEKRQVLQLGLNADETIVSGDGTRLQQVFWNLLNNAVKFTPRGGIVTVTSRCVSGMIEICVSDTGIGISEKELARIFAPFSQGDHAGDGTAHRFGGLGLGLAISRKLVELHAGRISAQSPGRDAGAKFTVALPLAVEQHPVDDAARFDPAPGCALPAGARVLLVEDHEPTRVALTGLLQRRGYQVVAAGTSEEALRQAEAQSFAFAISDIGLPDGDGYQLMQTLRDRQGLRGVALSGYGMEEDIQRGRAAGFIAHLTKPVNVRTLEEVLVRLQTSAA